MITELIKEIKQTSKNYKSDKYVLSPTYKKDLGEQYLQTINPEVFQLSKTFEEGDITAGLILFFNRYRTNSEVIEGILNLHFDKKLRTISTAKQKLAMAETIIGKRGYTFLYVVLQLVTYKDTLSPNALDYIARVYEESNRNFSTSSEDIFKRYRAKLKKIS